MLCEICKQSVTAPHAHWSKTGVRPEGYWTCHSDRGKCRCAKCDHRWKPRVAKIPERCPACGEKDDLFWADDGGWEKKQVSVRNYPYMEEV